MSRYREDPIWRRGAKPGELEEVERIDGLMAGMDKVRLELSAARQRITSRAARRHRLREMKS